ncbi:MAG: LysM peptidoglycan-binding domain-containing protein [Candidatus Cloacimonadota bacterium]|nr:LysM peptidoglycan-binding domain-containing protein [Candidatus Cloacimonadota bacterium]
MKTKKYVIISLLIILIPVFLYADVRYFSDEEYKDLSKQELLKYWEDLENELMMWQTREAAAREAIPVNEAKIAELEQKIQAVDNAYENLYASINKALGGITQDEIVEFQSQLDNLKARLDYYEKMPDSELYKNKDEILAFIDNYNNLKNQNIAKLPKFRSDFEELNKRILKLSDDLQQAKPEYYEDTHIVVKGECLWFISGYEHIYNNPTKWGIIYRANRDQIKDPDLIYPDQIFKIPRGLPTTWKVYKGECLWTISSYPEIYNNPFNWPRIFHANTDQIKDPDLIYPNQILRIPRD